MLVGSFDASSPADADSAVGSASALEQFVQ
jgi:hypothetical protein